MELGPLELWEADALRALLSLCGAVPELDVDPDDGEFDVPDELADPEELVGADDPTAGLVDDPDALDDPPDPELAGAAE